jgi:integrase
MTFLLTKHGAPFTAGGFGDNWFRVRCDEAGLLQRSAHGLRKLAATRLANAGCSDRQIMAITGHKTVSEVSRYTKTAEQAKLAEQAIAKLRERTKHDAELSSTPTPLDKTATK